MNFPGICRESGNNTCTRLLNCALKRQLVPVYTQHVVLHFLHVKLLSLASHPLTSNVSMCNYVFKIFLNKIKKIYIFIFFIIN